MKRLRTAEFFLFVRPEEIDDQRCIDQRARVAKHYARERFGGIGAEFVEALPLEDGRFQHTYAVVRA